MRDITLPLSEPITGNYGSSVTSIPVPKGTAIIITIYSCNRNKALWGEDADQWKSYCCLNNTTPKAVMEAKISGVYSNLRRSNLSP